MLLSLLKSLVDFSTVRYITAGLLSRFNKQLPSTDKYTASSSNYKMEDHETISYVTVPNNEVGKKLARRIVQHRLAACVNIVNNVDSIYEWEGELVQDEEAMLIVKSHSSKSEDLIKFVEKNHPYDCPEVITVKVDNGSEKYLNWVRDAIKKPPFGPISPSGSPTAP